MSGGGVEMVLDAAALLGEGPVWDVDSRTLLWLDILRHEVHRFDPDSGRDTVERFDDPVTALAPAAVGGPLAAVGGSVRPLHGGDWVPTPLPTGDRANDGKCDPAGRFLVGTLTERQQPGACGLYRVDVPGRVATVIDGVTLANGLDWSPDGQRLYFVDTPTRRIDVLDYDSDRGTARNRRPFVDLADAPGRPDGLTIDAEGGVWVALINGSQIRRYDEQGRFDLAVPVPARKVTSCAFGGPDLDELYVTSARFGMSERELAEDTRAGALFRFRPGTTGRLPHRWSDPRL